MPFDDPRHDDWRPRVACSPTGCQMWQARQEIRLLRKQLKEAMLKIAKLRKGHDHHEAETSGPPG